MCRRISCPVVRVMKKDSGPWIFVIFPGNQSVPCLLKFFTKTGSPRWNARSLA